MAKTKKRPATRRPTKAQIAAREARRKRQQRNRVVATVLIVVVLAGLVVLGVATSRPGKAEEPVALSSAADPSIVCSPDQKFDDIKTGTNGHTTKKVDYEIDPPSGGDHDPNPAAPGIYAEGKSPGDPRIVHALEHGYVAIWYNPDNSKADLTKLENVWRNFQKDVILVERRSLPSAIPVAATAWHNRLLCSGADDFQLANFVQQFVNQGPEKVPHTVEPEGRSPRT